MNIVFDLDGTLIDSAPDIQSAASAVLDTYDKAGLTLDETRRFLGEGAPVFVRRMMAARGLEDTNGRYTRCYDAFLARYECAVDKAVFYPGVSGVLAELKLAEHKLGLCTNKPERPARAVLRHMGMGSVFDAVIAGGMVASRKPEPEMLLATINALGGGPTLYVGDSEVDAETAQRAGVPFALYTEGYRKSPISDIHHDWAFDDFEALRGIVTEVMGLNGRK